LEPKSRSLREGSYFLSPEARSLPTNDRPASSAFSHTTSGSVTTSKKSVDSVPTRSVKTPTDEPSWLQPSTRRPPVSTVHSGAVSPSWAARSRNICSGATEVTEEKSGST
jgi:hypothetical protein